MEALFVETTGAFEDIAGNFVQLERRLGHPEGLEIEQSIAAKLENLNAKFERLEIYIMKEPPTRRQASRLKLNQLKYDAQHFNASLRSFKQKRFQKEREHSEREELLSRRHTSNNSQATSISIDHSLNHNQSLHNVNRGVDDMIGQGLATLGNLRDQKERLKKTRTRILDLANTLGLSNTVMNLIERRAYQDKFVLFGGMIVTLAICFLIYMYFV